MYEHAYCKAIGKELVDLIVMQHTSKVMMVKPVAFQYNPQTADSNAFMHDITEKSSAQGHALSEFESLVNCLKQNGVDVIVYEDNHENDTPDSIFPNNWLSTHADGRLVLYPMQAPNRRKERRADIIDDLKSKYHFSIYDDLLGLETFGQFLESTGSLILDRLHKIAYCALSDRATKKALKHWQALFPEYEIIAFHALDKNGEEIYHTNVMMCVGERYAVICLESIKNPKERLKVINTLKGTGKEIVEISLSQVYQFAGNMLEVTNDKRETLLVMSTSAYDSLNSAQIRQLEQYARIIHSNTTYIEKIAGGSVRCMICEIFSPS